MADQAPRLMDDPKPKKTRTVIEERTYVNDTKKSAAPEISGTIKTSNGNGEVTKVRWKNRRRMAWISLFALIGQLAVSLFVVVSTDVPVDRIKVLAEMMSWPSLAFASVIGAYMGFTTWAGKKR